MYGVTAYTMLLENGPFMKTPGRVSLMQSKKEKKKEVHWFPPSSSLTVVLGPGYMRMVTRVVAAICWDLCSGTSIREVKTTPWS